ncbi:chitobiosyldiphosphodolichol beta-mannosyltransferase-like [Amphiura filiformis]|uniref:chitobiosyldiphosphodolichol beta-mannosyltransferase-like n=1 Tax=Amphiura filiformis TaxID=82378 RepID=UPI003B21FE58
MPGIFSEEHLDIILQGGMVIFMEIYLYFQGLHSIMILSIALFAFMASGFRIAKAGSRACIIVLGDIGRSPRMQYHALSLAKTGFDVDIVGYGGSTPHSDLIENDKITQHVMSDPMTLPGVFPGLFRYTFKVMYQIAQLFFVIFVKMKWPSHIFVQNPPAIPTLPVAWFASKIYGSKFIVDWHNYGYTIMALTNKPTSPIVRLAKWIERTFGPRADGHFCVTDAMKKDLAQNWGVPKAITLYDRPPEIFKPTPLTEQHELFSRLSKDYPVFASSDSSPQHTVFTERKSSRSITKRCDRPALVVSGTSWTEDEDFSILLNALESYEDAISSGLSLPDLVCAITGKGPMKKYYMDIIAKKNWKHVKICTPWLTAEDYPKLLGSADVGVCLHKSSSGLDLPMKVVDMFGCGLPVCAIHFNCLDELVKHNENGLVFHDKEELAQQLQDLLCDFPEKQKQLETFRDNLKSFQKLRWEESWNNTVRKTLYI